MRTSGFGESRGSSTSGVLPIDSTMLPKRPPQGLLSSCSCAISPARYFRKCSEGLPSGKPGIGKPRIGEISRKRYIYPRLSKSRTEESMRSTRLTALLAVFLLAIASLVVAGCGSSDDDTTGGGGGGGGGEPLTVGSDIP